MKYVRQMARIGGQYVCKGPRERLTYRVHLPRMLELVVDVVQNPILFELSVKKVLFDHS